jgi:hypothetical protein
VADAEQQLGHGFRVFRVQELLPPLRIVEHRIISRTNEDVQADAERQVVDPVDQSGFDNGRRIVDMQGRNPSAASGAKAGT